MINSQVYILFFDSVAHQYLIIRLPFKFFRLYLIRLALRMIGLWRSLTFNYLYIALSFWQTMPSFKYTCPVNSRITPCIILGLWAIASAPLLIGQLNVDQKSGPIRLLEVISNDYPTRDNFSDIWKLHTNAGSAQPIADTYKKDIQLLSRWARINGKTPLCGYTPDIS